ncbi:hypothetical protein [Psychrobacillus sp. FSL H8-0487]|uniref:hypothetical protein n=1 Tax=Psychrobacillus sp. FSL H8-0487 TaxID=2921391 RepID=UPI0030FAF09E
MNLLFKKEKKKVTPLLFSPVYIPEILGAMYKEGEFLPHARMNCLFRTDTMLVGTAIKGEETLYFVATHTDVIKHIDSQGAVPLAQTYHLRFFKDKKRMNAHISKIVA